VTVALGIRPEHLREATAGSEAAIRGSVVVSEALGSEQLVHVEVDSPPVLTSEVQEIARDVDAAALDELRHEAAARRTTLLARFDSDVRPRTGEPIAMAVNAAKLHFFDLDSGAAIYA
jgi:multiple sugar transport system ATP-binding protein